MLPAELVGVSVRKHVQLVALPDAEGVCGKFVHAVEKSNGRPVSRDIRSIKSPVPDQVQRFKGSCLPDKFLFPPDLDE